jgi:hypothetical protein
MTDESGKLNRILTELAELRTLIEARLPAKRASTRRPPASEIPVINKLTIELMDTITSGDPNSLNQFLDSQSDEQRRVWIKLLTELIANRDPHEDDTTQPSPGIVDAPA